MKRQLILAHVGAFLLVYAGSLGYFYYRDRVARPAAEAKMSAPAVSMPSLQSNSMQVETVPLANEEAVVEQRWPVAIPDALHVKQVAAAIQQYDGGQNQDDVPALAALMEDPDPEVARVARDAYKARMEGIR